MYPISVIHTLDNRAFIVDGVRWTPVAVGTSLEDAQKMHRKMFASDYVKKVAPKVSNKFRTISMRSKSRKNVDGSIIYHVKVYEDGRIECDCPGYYYRHKCRHVEHVSTTIKKLKKRNK